MLPVGRRHVRLVEPDRVDRGRDVSPQSSHHDRLDEEEKEKAANEQQR